MLMATVAGNLGRDAESREVNGKTVVNFSVAASGRKRDDPPTWVRCAIWGQRGEALRQYLTKGTRVVCVGGLRVSTYDGKAQVDMDVADVTLMGGGERREDDRRDDPPQRQTGYSRGRAADLDDDFIPF